MIKSVQGGGLNAEALKIWHLEVDNADQKSFCTKLCFYCGFYKLH